MLLPNGKGVLVENPDRVNEARFIELALAEFPNLADEFAEEEGLFHLQMAAVSHIAQAAIERNDIVTLKRCYSLLEEAAKSATDEVQNAIYVSFLENLTFDNSNYGAEAKRLMPSILSEMLIELEEHWQKIGEWQVRAQDSQQRAREENERK